MPPKRIIATNKEEYEVEKKRYSKPKPFIQEQWLTDYLLERDREIWRTTKDPETKLALKEKYGVK